VTPNLSRQVVVVISEVPGFAGDISDEGAIKTVLAAQWRTIDRGGHSIYEEIKSSRPYCLALPCQRGLGSKIYVHSVSSDPSQPMTPARHAAHDPQVHRHRALRMRRVCRRRRVPLLLELAAHGGPLFAVGVTCGHA
jgi:hypothetical protein